MRLSHAQCVQLSRTFRMCHGLVTDKTCKAQQRPQHKLFLPDIKVLVALVYQLCCICSSNLALLCHMAPMHG
jgi:hypothetical protein